MKGGKIEMKRRTKIMGVKVKPNEIGHCKRLIAKEIKVKGDRVWQDINEGD